MTLEKHQEGEKEEEPFQFVESRRKPRSYRPRHPQQNHRYTPDQPQQEPASTAAVARNYSSSTGTITGAGSSTNTGFSYSRSNQTAKGKNRSRARARVGVVNAEEEQERTLTRAIEAVDVFVTYFTSAFTPFVDHQDAQARAQTQGDATRVSYAEQLCHTLERVWPRSAHISESQRETNEEESGSRRRGRRGVTAVVPERIVCLGLGSPTTSRSAQIQLGLLLAIRCWLLSSSPATPPPPSSLSPSTSCSIATTIATEIKSMSGTPSTTSANTTATTESAAATRTIECIAHDPVFTPQDQALLSRYNVLTPTPSTTNADTESVDVDDADFADGTGQHPDSISIDPDNDASMGIEAYYTSITIPTLLYMPHCDRDLYEHVLSLNYPPSPDLSPTQLATPSTIDRNSDANIPATTTTPAAAAATASTRSRSRPIVLLSNILQNYTTFNAHLEKSAPTLARLLQLQSPLQAATATRAGNGGGEGGERQEEDNEKKKKKSDDGGDGDGDGECEEQKQEGGWGMIELPNLEHAKRSSLLPTHSDFRSDASASTSSGENERQTMRAAGEEELGRQQRVEECITHLIKLWDRNALRDLGFHFF